MFGSSFDWSDWWDSFFNFCYSFNKNLYICSNVCAISIAGVAWLRLQASSAQEGWVAFCTYPIWWGTSSLQWSCICDHPLHFLMVTTVLRWITENMISCCHILCTAELHTSETVWICHSDGPKMHGNTNRHVHMRKLQPLW